MARRPSRVDDLLCGRDRIAVVSGLSARRIFFSYIHRWMRFCIHRWMRFLHPPLDAFGGFFCIHRW